jgi:hypothetical protein
MLFPFVVSILGMLFLLINAVLFWKSRKNKDFKYKLIAFYLSTIFGIEMVCHYIGYMNPYSNHYLSHYVFVVQFILLSIFFHQLFSKRFLKIIVLVVLFAVIGILTIQYVNNPNLYYHFNLLEIGLTTLPLVLYGGIFLLKNLKNLHPYFYFTLGLIFYLISSSAIFLSGNTEYVIFEKPLFVDIWVFDYLFYLLYMFLVFREWQFLTGKKEYTVI